MKDRIGFIHPPSLSSRSGRPWTILTAFSTLERDAGVLKSPSFSHSGQVIQQELYVEIPGNGNDGCIQFLTCLPVRLLVSAQVSVVEFSVVDKQWTHTNTPGCCLSPSRSLTSICLNQSVSG